MFKNDRLSGVIDFGGMEVGDPACDLVIAWTLLEGTSRIFFKQSMDMDPDTWLRDMAWALWKAAYELSKIKDHSDNEACSRRMLIKTIIEEHDSSH